MATFVLRGGADPTYDIIYDGKWPNDKPYATIHRIASSGEATGIMHTALQYALTLYDNIRIDTHRDNLVMQHLLACFIRLFIFPGIMPIPPYPPLFAIFISS